MNVINAVRIEKTQTPREVPAEGFYVDMRYAYYKDGETTVTAGPFPESTSAKHLVPFLNVLEAMRAMYPGGKGGYDDYEDVPEYRTWFDTEYKDDPAGIFRYNLGIQVQYAPDDSGCVAELTGYGVRYHDGVSADAYPVTLIYARDNP